MENLHAFYLHLFNSLPSMTGNRLRKINSFFPDLKEAWGKIDLSELNNLGLTDEAVKQLDAEKKLINESYEFNFLQKEKIKIIAIRDPDYPLLLKEIYDPPAILYYQGTFLSKEEKCLAVVGTRRLSNYGKQIAENFSYILAKNELTIVSGLALGIDTISHKAALNAGGRTVAVLGSGLSFIYPAQNRELADRIRERGALISELPPRREPETYFFPLRNRILSGIALGTLIIEAREKSGALITADIAIQQNREVFAIPGNVTNLTATGPNKLIQNFQAYPALKPEDILEKLNITPIMEGKNSDINFETAEEKMIYSLILSPLHIDQIMQKSGLNAAKINSLLPLMELKNLVKNIGGNIYGRN